MHRKCTDIKQNAQQKIQYATRATRSLRQNLYIGKANKGTAAQKKNGEFKHRITVSVFIQLAGKIAQNKT